MELLEASCYGDIESTKTLLNHGSDPNFVHPINGFSPLHWAAKRNHLHVVELLLSKGADLSLKSKDLKLPSDLATDDQVLAALNAPPKNPSSSVDSYTPHYLKNPPLDYKVDISKIVDKRPVNPTIESMPVQAPISETHRDITIVKVRLDSEEFFVEASFSPSQIRTFEDFVQVLVQELDINSIQDVSLVVKLPNTRLRKVEEVKRLSNYQEIMVKTR